MTATTSTDAPQDEAIQPARLNGVFFITPHVATLRTYYEALGWRSARTDDLFVPFVLDGGAFALFDEPTAGGHLAGVAAADLDFNHIGLCTVVDSPDLVDRAAAAATQAGGRVVSAPASTAYGRATWIADPSDTIWEICWIDGTTSDAPFDGGPDSGALVPRLRGVTMLTTDVSPLRTFYGDGLGWTVGTPEGDGGSLDLDLVGLAVSFRQGGDDAAALDANRADVTGVIFNVPVSADELDSAVTQLADRGATELLSVDTPRATYLADPAGLTWKLEVGG